MDLFDFMMISIELKRGFKISIWELFIRYLFQIYRKTMMVDLNRVESVMRSNLLTSLVSYVKIL